MGQKSTRILIGLDIGGTKSAVQFAQMSETKEERPQLLKREAFPTPKGWRESFEAYKKVIREYFACHPEQTPCAVGISCGGPLDGESGIILSPPNLPGWDDVNCFEALQSLSLPVALQNDADACALAEWRWGAGQGTKNMVFLTFGTGMGAGLILNGALYTGACNLAGEVGHMRLNEDGPVGFGKAGSFEGFCSGGGIGHLGRELAQKALTQGNPPLFCPREEALSDVSAKTIGEAAREGDPLALSIYRSCGERLGQGIAVLIDLLNPERVVIGSIYGRQKELLEPAMDAVLQKECIPKSYAHCKVVPAGLGEQVGDYASLSVAALALE